MDNTPLEEATNSKASSEVDPQSVRQESATAESQSEPTVQAVSVAQDAIQEKPETKNGDSQETETAREPLLLPVASRIEEEQTPNVSEPATSVNPAEKPILTNQSGNQAADMTFLESEQASTDGFPPGIENEQQQIAITPIEEVEPTTYQMEIDNQPPVEEESLIQLDEGIRTNEESNSPTAEIPVQFDPNQPEHESSRIVEGQPADTLPNESGIAISEEDIETIASFFQVDNRFLQTCDRDMLSKFMSRVREYQDLRSSTQVTELNFEQFSHSANKKVDSLRKEVQQLQDQIRSLGERETALLSEKESLEKQLANAASTSLNSNKYSEDLKAKLQEASDAKRSAFEMLDIKQTQIIELNQEINRVSTSNQMLRSQLMATDAQKEELSSQALKEKFERNRLEQELMLRKHSADMYETELANKSQQLQELRKETRNQISNLESQLEKYKLNYNVSKASNDNLSDSLKDITSRQQQASLQVKQLNDRLALQQEKFAEEMASKDRLIQLLEKSGDDRKTRINSLEKLYNETAEKVAMDEAEYKSQVETLQEQVAEKAAKINELEDTIADLTQTNITNDMDTNDILGGLGHHNSVSFSPSAQKTLKNIGTGSSITDAISKTNKMKRDLIKEKRARVKAEEELQGIFKELERRMPLLQSYKERCQELEAKHVQMSAIIDSMAKEKSLTHTQLELANKKVGELMYQIRELNQYKIDLKRQVTVLLAEVTFKNDSQDPLTREEKEYISRLVGSTEEENNNSTDTGALISQRLTTFKSIAELMEKNEQLLTVSRNLGNELENGESSNGNVHDDEANEAVEKATTAILQLREQLQQTETQLKAATSSRDMLQEMIDNGSANAQQQQQGKQVSDSNEMFKVTQELRAKQQELHNYRKEVDENNQKLNSKIQQLNSEKSQISLEYARAKSSIELLEQQSSSTKYMLNVARSESKELKAYVEKLQNNLSKLELRTQELSDELLDSRTVQASLEIQLKGATSERQMWKSVEERLRSEMNTLIDEKSKLNSMLSRLQALDSERSTNHKDSVQRLTQTIETLQKELETARSKVEFGNDETKRVLHSKNADSQLYQKRIDSLSSELNATRETLLVKTNAVEQLTIQLETIQKKYDETSNRKSSAMAVMAAATDSTSDISSLKQELTNTLEDLDLAVSNANQYKEIADATEKELAIINETYAKYKETTDAKLTESTKEIENLSVKLEDLGAERSKLQDEFDSLSSEYSSNKQQFELKVSELSYTIEAFDGIKSDYESRLSVVKEDVESKNELAKKAQSDLQSKSDELEELFIAHSQLKDEYTALQERNHKLESDLDKVKSSLITAEDAWNSQKASLEEELRTSSTRVMELDTQNRTLINQLESSPTVFDSGEDSNSNMNSLITYLHREKDSLSQQLEYSKSEEKRLRQMLTMNEAELTEYKTELAKVKDQAESVSKYTSILSEMKESLHELELYRENNTSLREENANYGKRVEDLEQQAMQMNGQLQPLQQELNKLNSELSAKEAELKLTASEIDYWKKRSESLLHGKEATNENELNLRSEITELKTQLLVLQQSEKATQERHEKLKKEAQEKLRKNYEARNALTAEKESLSAQLKEYQTKYDESVAELKKIAQGKESDDGTSGLTEKLKSTEEDLAKSNSELGQLKSENSKLKFEHDVNMKKLRTESEALKSKIAELSDKLASSASATTTSNGSPAVDVEKLKEEFKKEKEMALKAQADELKSTFNPSNPEEMEKYKKQLESELSAKFAEDLEAHKRRLRQPTQAKINEIIEARSKVRIQELNKEYEAKVKELEGKYSNRDSSSATDPKEIETLKASFEKEKSELVKKFEFEKEQLKKDTSSAVRKETEFRENILKKQLASLKEKVKKLETPNATTPSPAAAPVQSSDINATPAPSQSATALSTSTPAQFPKAATTIASPAPTSIPSLPGKPQAESPTPQKRAAEGDDSEGKRTKTE